MYETRVCCFLDILGFRRLIEETTTDPLKISPIIEALNMAREHFGIDDDTVAKKLNSSKIVTQFSDSIVISFKYDEKSGVYYNIDDIQMYVGRLIYRGFLVRGGIAVGDLIHNEKIVLGPAMISAYDMECKQAIYPRIILDEELIKIGKIHHATQHDGAFEEKMINRCVTQDDDGRYYVDYFAKQFENLDDPEDVPDYCERLQSMIGKGLLETDNKVVEKYEWARKKFNAMIDDLPVELHHLKLK